jgi:hypothetical protein
LLGNRLGLGLTETALQVLNASLELSDGVLQTGDGLFRDGSHCDGEKGEERSKGREGEEIRKSRLDGEEEERKRGERERCDGEMEGTETALFGGGKDRTRDSEVVGANQRVSWYGVVPTGESRVVDSK